MNLLEVLKNQLSSGDTMSVISNLLGEDKTATSSGLDAILPTLLGSVIQKGASTEGINSLLSLLKTGGHDGSVLNNIGGLLGGGVATNNLLNTGSGLLTTLLGDKIGGVVNLISGTSGLKTGSTSSLLKLAAPLLMGLIGKESSGLGASGLTSLLMGQTDYVKAALPAGISNLLGLTSLNSPSSSAATTTASTSDTGGGVNSILPWVIGAAVLGGLFITYKSCSKTEITPPAVVTETTRAVTDSATATMGAVSADANKAVAALKVSLPGGVVLDVPKGSLEDRMVTYIQSKDSISKSLWFDFDRLLFETNKSVLKPESQQQLKNTAAIMKAFPKVKIKMGGYTDNTGNAAGNMKLSGDRAKNVMAELVKLGVAANRMTSEGYGSNNPVATNETEAGRAQNRRISISVREK